jgi:uncharacterized membrane-anchored protein
MRLERIRGTMEPSIRRCRDIARSPQQRHKFKIAGSVSGRFHMTIHHLVRKLVRHTLVAFTFGAAALAASAQTADAAAAQRAFGDARKAAIAGPHDVPLAGQAVLKLPAGHAFVPQPQAGAMLNAMGNPGHDEQLQGLIFPKGDNDSWFIIIRYVDEGYIKDDEAKDWNADELLQSYREGTEEANKEREKMGVPAIEIEGWAEKPAYDAQQHRLVWAMSSHERGAAAGSAKGVNYNTYALGREGYFSLNLVTGLNELPAHKPAAQTMLSALQFDDGKRYADFDASTDKVAAYGLAALVAGVAAKKLGFLALALAFVAKFAKVAILAVAGFGAVAARWFKRGRNPTA